MVNSREAQAVRVSAVTMAVNILLSVFQLFAGIFARSGAMISDAVHSASDVFSTIIVIIGVKISSKKADDDHPYGHERLECVSAILLSGLLLATGILIGYSGVKSVFFGEISQIPVPGVLALTAAVISVAVKEAMYWYTRHYAKKLDSGALMADAWHHRSDALSSVGSFAGILGARLGFPVLDPIASLVICVFIVKAAADIFRSSIDKMTDHACDRQTERDITDLAFGIDGVMGVDRVMTRVFGDRIYVDMEISANGEDTLNATHAVAQAVHDKIEKEFPKVKHCMVHVNPFGGSKTTKE